MADNITITFSGSIHASSASDFVVGTPFSGLLTYSTNDPLYAADSRASVFLLTNANDRLFISLNGVTFTALPDAHFETIVSNGPNSTTGDPNTEFFFAEETSVGNLVTTFSRPGYTLSELVVQFVGNLDLLDSNSLPVSFDPSNLLLNPFQGTPTAMVIVFTNSAAIGTITSVTVTPEPSSLWLMATGCFALGAMGTRKTLHVLSRVGTIIRQRGGLQRRKTSES